MQYLYNYNNRIGLFNDKIEEFMIDQLEKYYLIDDEDNFELKIKEGNVKIEFDFDMLIMKINSKYDYIHNIKDYYYDNYIYIRMNDYRKTKYVVKFKKEENIEKLISILENIRYAKECAMDKYYRCQEELNEEFEYYKFKTRINNEEVYYMYYCKTFESMSKEEKIQLLELIKRDGNIYLKIYENEFKLSKVLYPYLYNAKINDIFCSDIELTSTLTDYYVDIELDLLVKKNNGNDKLELFYND